MRGHMVIVYRTERDARLTELPLPATQHGTSRGCQTHRVAFTCHRHGLEVRDVRLTELPLPATQHGTIAFTCHTAWHKSGMSDSPVALPATQHGTSQGVGLAGCLYLPHGMAQVRDVRLTGCLLPHSMAQVGDVRLTSCLPDKLALSLGCQTHRVAFTCHTAWYKSGMSDSPSCLTPHSMAEVRDVRLTEVAFTCHTAWLMSGCQTHRVAFTCHTAWHRYIHRLDTQSEEWRYGESTKWSTITVTNP
ncbi:hypothetical protein J6590_025268 [Homalodisca vitripennis]|nr:hypothetical protein J6590_025268 [Homalodisca vitripennis]